MVVETLEPVWSGALEHDGAVPGLSRYAGKSSLYHSASWAYAEALEQQAMIPAPIVIPPPPAWMPPKPTAPKLTKEREGAVAVLLRKGVSYRKLVRDFGITLHQARRVAKQIGLVRKSVAA